MSSNCCPTNLLHNTSGIMNGNSTGYILIIEFTFFVRLVCDATSGGGRGEIKSVDQGVAKNRIGRLGGGGSAAYQPYKKNWFMEKPLQLLQFACITCLFLHTIQYIKYNCVCLVLVSNSTVVLLVRCEMNYLSHAFIMPPIIKQYKFYREHVTNEKSFSNQIENKCFKTSDEADLYECILVRRTLLRW